MNAVTGRVSIRTPYLRDASFVNSGPITLGYTSVGDNFLLASVGGSITLDDSIGVGSTMELLAFGDITETANAHLFDYYGAVLISATGSINLPNADNLIDYTLAVQSFGSALVADEHDINLVSATVGGDLTLLSKDSINIVGSVQSASGNLSAIAGWDGVTLDPDLFTNAGVYGNNEGSVTIGGIYGEGGVAFGSGSGTHPSSKAPTSRSRRTTALPRSAIRARPAATSWCRRRAA